MKIAVIGAGAIGSGVGVLLQQVGHEVSLVGRAYHVAQIRAQSGVIMNDGRSGKSGASLIPIAASERLETVPDILIVATKGQDVTEACRDALPYAKGVPAVMFQNSVSTDAAAGDILGRTNIIGCIVRLGVIFLRPGVIERVNDGWLIIGETFQANGERVARVARALGQGIETIVTDNVTGARWTKLLLSVQALTQAMTGLVYSECNQYDELRLIALALVQETVSVADRAGVTMVPIDGISLAALDEIRRLPPILQMQLSDVPLAAMPILVFTAAFSRIGSTLQSRKRGKDTEVDYLNGDVVRVAQQLGMKAPLNERIVQLMHELEKNHTYLSPQQLWRACTE